MFAMAIRLFIPEIDHGEGEGLEESFRGRILSGLERIFIYLFPILLKRGSLCTII